MHLQLNKILFIKFAFTFIVTIYLWQVTLISYLYK